MCAHELDEHPGENIKCQHGCDVIIEKDDDFCFLFCSQVGASACGKSSLVRTLATLTGNELQVLPMNSSMDTTELLGGFEQVRL